MDFDTGLELLNQAISSSVSSPWSAADSQAACVELMACFGFSEHQRMPISHFETQLRATLQLHEALAQGRLRVHDRELHV